jgi:hypothetical protein
VLWSKVVDVTKGDEALEAAAFSKISIANPSSVDGGFRPVLVGGQKDLERGVVRDLHQERAGGAKAQDGVVPGLLFEERGDLFRRLGEVGGDRNVGLGGQGQADEGRQQRGESGEERSQLRP